MMSGAQMILAALMFFLLSSFITHTMTVGSVAPKLATRISFHSLSLPKTIHCWKPQITRDTRLFCTKSSSSSEISDNQRMNRSSKLVTDHSARGSKIGTNPDSIGYHQPVMLEECCKYLRIEPDKLYIDCTLGGGGHTKAILERGGCVVGIDQDTDAIRYTSNLLKDYISAGKLEIIQSNFRSIIEVIKHKSKLAKTQPLRGILMDLGISSYQIDNPSRGFSFGADGPLDMRMNQSTVEVWTVSASDVLNTASVEDIADILYNYGEEPKSRQIAREIVASRPLQSTSELTNIISRLTPYKQRSKVLARCFQALRIHVNDEIGALKDALENIHQIMPIGARLVVMSYHSLEDRVVKNVFKCGRAVANETSTDATIPWDVVTKKAVMASSSEVNSNRRSRSAKLRVGEILDVSRPEKLAKTLTKYGSYLGKKQLAKAMSETDTLSGV